MRKKNKEKNFNNNKSTKNMKIRLKIQRNEMMEMYYDRNM